MGLQNYKISTIIKRVPEVDMISMAVSQSSYLNRNRNHCLTGSHHRHIFGTAYFYRPFPHFSLPILVRCLVNAQRAQYLRVLMILHLILDMVKVGRSAGRKAVVEKRMDYYMGSETCK